MSTLLEAVNSWAFNIDKGNVNEVVFLDLKKAFDKVDFSTFLSTLYTAMVLEIRLSIGLNPI